MKRIRIKTIVEYLELTLKLMALPVTIGVFGFLLLHVYREVSHDVLIVDSFSVPKQLEEAGFTPDVVANQIFNTMQEINADAHAQIEKDEVTWARDVPDVEVPGTKLGMKTFTEMARAIIPGTHKATHINGIVALQTSGPSSVKSQLTVTIYFKDNRWSPITFVPRANDIDSLAKASGKDSLTREIAEKIWERDRPFVLASYQFEQRHFEEARKLALRIIADKPPDNGQVAAAYALVGKVLSDPDSRNYDEAFANLKHSIDLNSKSPFPYIVWGNALASLGKCLDDKGDSGAEKKYDEAIEKYKKAIELDSKSPVPYNTWGNTLRYKKNYQEAIAKYKKAIKKDPTFAPAYSNWGHVFFLQNNDSQAIECYQRANDIDPRATNHKWWGQALSAEEKYDEAIAQFQKAVEIDPDAVNGYNGWGDALAKEKRYDEAIEQYKKSIKHGPNYPEAYTHWGNALLVQGKQKAAEEKFAKATSITNDEQCDAGKTVPNGEQGAAERSPISH